MEDKIINNFRVEEDDIPYVWEQSWFEEEVEEDIMKKFRSGDFDL